MTDDSAIHDQFLELDRSFCMALTNGTVTQLSGACEEVFARARQAICRGRLTSDTVQLVQAVTMRIYTVSSSLAALERKQDDLILEALRDTRVAISNGDRCETLLPLASDDAGSELSDDPTTFTPYRQWFLDHLSNPYPTSKDKDALLKQVTVHTRRQLDTWYTNQRRRSGWHALKRKYGHISTLLKRIDEADEDDEEMQRARKEVERVKAYFKNDRQDHVRDEIREIISQGPPTTSTKRRIESGPPRRVGGNTARPRSHFPGNPPSTPAPLMPGSWTPYSVTHDDDFFSPAPTSHPQPAPRLPSDFSSPDSSRRTFSGSSSSSTDSLISYDSLDIPVSTPGPASPPASSSLLNFDGRSAFVHSSPARTSRHSPRRGSFVVRNSVYPTRPHPYFCTVNELPTGSSLARFASS